jgi:hypothetical protein
VTSLLPERGTTLGLLRPYLESYAAHLPLRRVAVVGNKPLAPDAERAAAIDSADLVIRCNSFTLDDPGDPPCLGTRVNVCVIAFVTRITPYTFRDYTRRAYLVPEVGQAGDRVGGVLPPKLPPSWPADLGSMGVPNDMLGMELVRGMSRPGDKRGAVPTTGTLAVALAYHLFPDVEIDIAGFSFLENRAQQTWRHHVGAEVPVHPAHFIDREGALLQSWVDEGRLAVLP